MNTIKFGIQMGLLILGGVLLAGTVFWMGLSSASASVEDTYMDTYTIAEAAQPQVEPAAPVQAPQQQRVLLAAPLVKATSDLTGLDIPDVLTELDAGRSLADIATANGTTADAVVQQATDQVRDRLVRAVDAGLMTEDELNTIMARVETRANELVNDTTLGENITSERERHMARLLVRATSNLTGLTIEDIEQQSAAGATLAEIAAAEGIEPDAVVEAGLDLMAQQLALAVDEGVITQEFADQRIEECRVTSQRLMDDPTVGTQVAQQADRLVLLGLGHATVEATGLPRREVMRRVVAGETLAEIATAEGATVEAVLDDFTQHATTLLNRGVERGTMTRAEADTRLVELTAAAATQVNEPVDVEALRELRRR